MDFKNIIILSIINSVILLFISIPFTEGYFQRCYQCRSRGELGTCKDPFTWNITQIDEVRGVQAVPCSSGWCGKLIESESALSSTDDYDKPTQRMCIQRGPSDSEDRCAFTLYNYKKVYMCFCQGDLCNTASILNNKFNYLYLLLIVVVVVVGQLY